jgi:NAD(P)-dependent dehydrogenase (short-subunit alcohol dehydrogenase family)
MRSVLRPVAEQTILITGATDGLGRALAAELAAAGATLIIHGRDDARGRETIDEIHGRTGNENIHWLRADFASLDEVRTLAQQVTAEHQRATCLHPATFMPTKMVIASGINPTSSLEDGVRATLRLIADPELDGVTGRYFDGLRPAEPHRQARDPDARRRLRELSDRLCGVSHRKDGSHA